MIKIRENQQSDEKVFTSSYLKEGWNQVKINSIEVTEAKTGSKALIFHVEGKPVGETFRGVEGALGQVGKVKTIYFNENNEDSLNNFTMLVLTTAMKFGKEKEARAISADSIEEYVSKIEKLVCNNTFVWMMFTGEEYSYDKEGKQKIGVRLGLPKFNFIKAVEEVESCSYPPENGVTMTIEGVSKAPYSNKPGVKFKLSFDYKDKYHYKKLETPDSSSEIKDKIVEDDNI